MSEIENAKRLLKELLGDYRVRRVGDIYRIAAAKGITKQTLKMARKEIGVQSSPVYENGVYAIFVMLCVVNVVISGILGVVVLLFKLFDS